ncbi:MAG: hypothetical protein WCK47_03800 [bacterium]|nr:hypothetical protein [Candidatus Sumerlaeota bacterium]
MENLVDLFGVWLTVLLTLAVFSFLYRDNPVYKIAEHLYIGIAAGYTFYQAFRTTIYPNLVQHMIDGAQKIQAGDPAGWQMQWRFGAFVLGMLMLSRLVPSWSWVSRWPMALVVGAFAGLNLIGYARANLVDQISATMIPLAGRMPGVNGMLPLLPQASPGDSSIINHLVLVVGVISVLTYFFFSKQQNKPLRRIGVVGIWFVMITFGATYGSIVLARVSLLIGRVYILTDANQPSMGYPFVTGAGLIIAALVIWRIWLLKPDDRNPRG